LLWVIRAALFHNPFYPNYLDTLLSISNWLNLYVILPTIRYFTSIDDYLTFGTVLTRIATLITASVLKCNFMCGNLNIKQCFVTRSNPSSFQAVNPHPNVLKAVFSIFSLFTWIYDFITSSHSAALQILVTTIGEVLLSTFLGF
jgi:hypothetical protein